MKGLFFVFALLTIVSCTNNVEQYRTSIEELGSKWDSITTTVNSFSETLNMESNNFSGAMSSMAVNDEMFSKLSEEEQAKINAAKESYANAGAGFGEMQKTVDVFSEEWAAKSAELAALKDGLASGNLEGDVAAKLNDLTTYLAQAEAKIPEWTGQLEAMKTSIASTQSVYSNMVAEMTPAEK